jgi:hypothetical protein
MSEKRHLTVKEPLRKKYRVYTTDPDGRLRELVAEYDTLEELKAHRWRLDNRYKICAGKKWYLWKRYEKWIEEHGPAIGDTEASG